LTGLALSVAGLATAQDPVQIFNEQLTSHAAIAGAALSLTAGSMIGGDLAAGAAATLGAGSGHSTDESYQPNIYAGAATTLGASTIVNDIVAGGALTLGAHAHARYVSVGAAFTLGAGASVEPGTPGSVTSVDGAITTAQDMSNAVAQIHLAKNALYGLPTTSGADYQLPTTLTGGSFAPGVYHGTAVTFAANSQIQYENDTYLVNPVWVFNLDGAMNTGAMSTFVAPDSGTVIWNVGGALTLGAGTDFSGVALVEGAITAATSWVTCGNLYATAAISIGSLNEAALDCSVSAQQSAGLTVNEQNEVLLNGNAIDSDTPKCDYFGAKEIEWMTTKTPETSTRSAGDFIDSRGGERSELKQSRRQQGRRNSQMTAYAKVSGGGVYSVGFWTRNAPGWAHPSFDTTVTKEVFDACRTVLQNTFSKPVGEDTPECKYFGAKEMKWMTTKTPETLTRSAGDFIDKVSEFSRTKQARSGSDTNNRTMTAYALLGTDSYYKDLYKIHFWVKNVPGWTDESTKKYVQKNEYDACRAVLQNAFSTK
jgi:hypothetical protein